MFIKRGINLLVVVVVVFAYYSHKCVAQRNTSTFSYENSGWISFGNVVSSIDSSFNLGGITPLKISPFSIIGRKLPIDIDLHSMCKLPDIKNEVSVSVSFIIRTENIHNGKIYFRQINEQEEIIQIDSCFIPISKDSLLVNYEIDNRNARMLFIQVRSCGKSNYAATQAVWITPPLFVVKDEYNSDNQICNTQFKRRQPDLIDFTQINQLKSTPIIALGELLHGSESINKLVFDLIKYRIEFCNTKLVVLEFNVENIWSINRYIHGDEGFTKSSIKNMFDRTLFSNHILDLIDWIKTYNQQCEFDNHVWIGGTEIASNMILSKLYFHDFFKIFRDRYPDDNQLRRFCRLLLSSDESASKEIIQILDHTNDFHKILSKEEALFFRLYLKKLDLFQEGDFNIAVRDKKMFDLCDYFICRNDARRLGQDYTITIYTHFWHANYLNGYFPTYDPHSMGYWLKQKYGHNYKCLGITCSEGNILSKIIAEDGFVENPIIPNIESIEYSLSHIGESFFIDSQFYQMNKLNPTTLVGAFFRKDNIQFMNIAKRADGLFYLRKSIPIFKPQEVRDEKRQFNEWLLDWYKKELNEYKK